MRNLYCVIFLLAAFVKNGCSQTMMHILDSAIFYDGYAKLVDEPTPKNSIRLRNDLVSTKITNEQIATLGSQLSINVIISALCDNYDRIGNINLAMIPKGQSSYTFNDAIRIEIGRFITPFMDKNKEPNSVSYSFNADDIVQIINLNSLRKKFDFWLELEIFGVPYAANTEIEGCNKRNDVFQGKVDFVTSGTKNKTTAITEFIPITHKFMLNNYDINQSDSLGLSQKTFSFEVKKKCSNCKLVIITSNHGANEDGEEYVRRWHYVSVDDKEVLKYLPGGKSCEPWRKFNTQGNGIYEAKPFTDEQWTAWNNWCPGDVIPVREIELGNIKKGIHSIKINVPEAQFVDKQGYFPVSFYIVGSK